MSASVNHLDERTQDSGELLEDIMPSAITLAMMLHHPTAGIYQGILSQNPRNTDGFPPL